MRLSLIADELQMVFAERPQTEVQWLKALLAKIFPEMSDEDINSIIEERCLLNDGVGSDEEEGKDGNALLMNVSGETDTFRGVLAADDFDEIGEMKEKRRRRELKNEMAERQRAAATKAGAKKKAKAQPKALANSGAASSSGAPERVPTGIDLELPADLAPEALRKYLPAVTGCSLVFESLWHTRWRCTYPSTRPPYSRSETVRTSTEIWPVAKALIRWAWSQHRGEGGDECPWECIVRDD